MLKLLHIINKDLRLLIRSRGSASIIVLGPLIVILLVGFGFNTTNAYKINIGAYSPSYSPLSESILEKLEADEFTIEKTTSNEDCISSVKNGINHICMILPEGLSADSQESKSIVYYVDYSRINLVYAILNSISSQVEIQSSEISLQLTQSLLDVIEKTESELVAKRGTIGSLSANNQIASSRLSNFETYFSNVTSKISTDEIAVSINNITSLVESTNLSSKKKDYVIDTLEELESEFSSQNEKVNSLKANIGNEAAAITEIIGKSSQDISLIDSSISLISEKISKIASKNASKIVSPISTEIQPVNATRNYLNYTFPTLLILILSFVSLILSSMLVINERTSNAYFRNTITPTKDILFIIANLLTPLTIVFVQMIIILIIALIFFKAAFISSIGTILLTILLSSSLFIMIGMFLANLFKSEETVTIATISFLSLLIFFSNIILPVESLPGFIRLLANLNPIVIAETIFKRAILFNTGFANVFKGIIILIAYIIMLDILLFMQYNFIKDSYKLKKIVYRK